MLQDSRGLLQRDTHPGHQVRRLQFPILQLLRSSHAVPSHYCSSLSVKPIQLLLYRAVERGKIRQIMYMITNNLTFFNFANFGVNVNKGLNLTFCQYFDINHKINQRVECLYALLSLVCAVECLYGLSLAQFRIQIHTFYNYMIPLEFKCHPLNNIPTHPRRHLFTTKCVQMTTMSSPLYMAAPMAFRFSIRVRADP